jgi:glycosyltransferase involved in cell wall biosynthesis
VSEVVFFGRLEQRKGVLLFCEAVEALMQEEDNVFRRHGVHLTFMGRATDDSHGRDILKRIEALRVIVSERSPTSRFKVSRPWTFFSAHLREGRV